MKLFYSERQQSHRDGQEIAYGHISPANDRPDRATAIRDALLASGSAALHKATDPVPPSVLHAVHDPAMLTFLESLHKRCRHDTRAHRRSQKQRSRRE